MAGANPEWKRMNDIQRGALLFQIKCQRCHSNGEGEMSRRGPNLFGVVGRRAGSAKYKKYSAQLKQSGVMWSRKTLKEYMNCPQKMVPGTTMFYGANLPADVQTDCIVSYMESISPGYQERLKAHKDSKVDIEKIQNLPGAGHPEVPLMH